MPGRKWIAAVFCAAAAGGCQSPAARGPAPAPCDQFGNAPLLQLPQTRAPENLSTSKSAPYQYAVALPVNRDLQEAGRWADLPGGWSALTLRVISAGATSLSANFTPLALPADAQLWLCSADGRQNQGPLSAQGELQTPVVRGGAAGIVLLVPTDARAQVQVKLAQVNGGFR